MYQFIIISIFFFVTLHPIKTFFFLFLFMDTRLVFGSCARMQIMRNVKEWKISDHTCASRLKYRPILIIMMLMQPNYGFIDSPIPMLMKRNHFWSVKSKVGIQKKSTNHSPFTMQTVQVCSVNALCAV